MAEGLRWRNADGVGAAGANGAASLRLKGLVHADFDCGEIVVAAAQRQAGARNGGIGLGKEIEDPGRRHRGLAAQRGKLRRNCDAVHSLAGQMEEGVGRETGTCAVRMPLVFQQVIVGVDITVLRWIGWAGSAGTVLRIGTIRVLWPESMQRESAVLRALGCAGMAVAELGRPGEIEQIVVEDGRLPGGGKSARMRTRASPFSTGLRSLLFAAAKEDEQKSDCRCRCFLHRTGQHKRNHISFC